MITTLLIDLDDTLIKSDSRRFMPAYMRLISDFLSDSGSSERVMEALTRAIRAMLENDDPGVTLKERFDDVFYAALGTTEAAHRTTLVTFYRREFPKLGYLTQPMPGAVSLLKSVFEIGLEVVIATNPLYPLAAIEQRLAEVGLGPGDLPYAAITGIENSHFSKPRMAYLAEILGRLGRSPDEAAMVGDDVENDLVPAHRLGMAVFQIRANDSGVYPGGRLEHVLDWLLEAAPQEVIPSASHRPEQLLELLKGQLASMLGLVGDPAEVNWIQRPEPEAWAPVEILCHLRDVEREVNQPRIEAILNEDMPFIAAKDTDLWAEERDYLAQSGPRVLEEWIGARQSTIAQLSKVGSEGWSREGQHALLGPSQLSEIVAVGVQHELLHLGQMKSTLSAIGQLAA